MTSWAPLARITGRVVVTAAIISLTATFADAYVGCLPEG